MEKTEKTTIKESSLSIPEKKVSFKSPAGNKKSWQRLTISIIGIAIVVAMWRWAVYHLYFLPEHSVTAFTNLTNASFYTIGALVFFFVTGKTIYDYKLQGTTSVVQTAQSVTEDIKHKIDATSKNENTNIDIVLTDELKKNIKEEGVDAPELKPFSHVAVGDEEGGKYNDF